MGEEASPASPVDDGETAPEPRVLVAVADVALRTVWEAALRGSAEPRLDVCGVVATAPEAVRAASEARPDVALIAARIAGDGVAAAWEIVRTGRTHVIVLGDPNNDGDLFGALRAGAAGYLPVDVNPARLPRIVDAVLAGEAVLPRAMVRRVIDRFRDRRPGRPQAVEGFDPAEPLTGREWDVLEMLIQGSSTREIADELTIADVTVRTHVASILRKLRAPNREALRDPNA